MTKKKPKVPTVKMLDGITEKFCKECGAHLVFCDGHNAFHHKDSYREECKAMGEKLYTINYIYEIIVKAKSPKELQTKWCGLNLAALDVAKEKHEIEDYEYVDLNSVRDEVYNDIDMG